MKKEENREDRIHKCSVRKKKGVKENRERRGREKRKKEKG
jgi:hypothetical protein